MLERRPKVAEVAARAGVSTATVDRVINGRGGVHHATVARVEKALREIASSAGRRRRVRRAPATDRFDIFLPANSGRSTEVLGEAIARVGAERGARTEVIYVTRMDPSALASELIAARDRGSAGVAFQGVDHPVVRAAVQEVRRSEIPVLTLCSDIAGVDRLAYVGVDNRAAGRTAGWLMGRFCRAPGKLAVVWGGQLYRSHEERASGFRAVLRHEFSDLELFEMVDGKDDADLNFSQLRTVIDQNADLRGVYCVGGGQRGVAAALEAAGVADRVVMIGHNFNDETQPFLLSGTMDAVIHQDMARIAAAALDGLMGIAPPPASAAIPVEIITRENMMYR